MKIEVKNLPHSEVALTISLTSDEFSSYLQKAARKISSGLKIKGFRPGKAPYEIVKKEIGEMKIYEEAAELAIPQAYVEAILAKKIEAIGRPKVAIKQIAPGNDFTFEAQVAVMPEINLGDYKKLKKDEKKIEVKNEEVEREIKFLQKSRGKNKEVAREAKEKDRVEVDFQTFLGKVPIEGGTSKNHPVIIGEGHFVPGFEEKLEGMKKGEKKEFTLRFPQNYYKKELANRDVQFKVEMKKVEEIVLPPIDDQFAKSLGKFENLADLKSKLRDNIFREKEAREKERRQVALLEQVAKKTKFGEIPQVLIEGESDKMIQEMQSALANQGLSLEKYLANAKKKMEDFKKDLEGQALRRIKSALVLRKIAEKENLKADEKEVEERMSEALRVYQNTEEARKKVDLHALKHYVEGVMLNQKVFELLEEIAK